MKKRMIGMVLLTMVLLTGCGSVEEKPLIESNVPVIKEESPIESPQAVSDVGQTEHEVQAVNLTEKNDTEICIDYSINSYSAVQNFSYDLFSKNMEETNPVLSPVSAYLALALTGAGAEGDTWEEFKEVLGDLESVPNDLMLGLPKDEEGMHIALANSAWVDELLTPNQDWLAWADSIYKAEVFQTKLSTADAMMDMNQWVNDKTEGLIPNLLDKPLSMDARLALFNTIYFKGDWRNPFKAESTTEREFTLEDGNIEMVEMMQQYKEKQLYVKNDYAEGVVLPYKDTTKAFVALKPLGNDTVREMYEQLDAEDISAILQQQETTLCNLQLPKFEVEFSKSLNNSLKEMGLEKAFDAEEADFSRLGTLDSGAPMYIDLVYQKAVVTVDEKGTEAAAVTMVVMNELTAIMEEEKPVDLYFDEPFLYMIVDVEREVPLFIGIMDNPNT